MSKKGEEFVFLIVLPHKYSYPLVFLRLSRASRFEIFYLQSSTISTQAEAPSQEDLAVREGNRMVHAPPRL